MATHGLIDEPLSTAHLVCPFATDAHLREHDPVHYVESEDVYLVSRHDDVQAVLRDPETFSNRFGRLLRSRDRLTKEALDVLAQGWEPVDTLFTTDPPEHRRFRSLVNAAFSARRVEGLTDLVRDVAGELVDDAVAARRVDVVEAFAVPLPMAVIAYLLGVPAHDLPLFKRWSDAVVSELGRLQSDEEQIEAARLVVEFQQYFYERIQERQEEPTGDLLSDLVHARLEDEAPLSTEEILTTLMQLLVAGNETTTSAVAWIVWRLARDEELQRRVRQEPERIPNLVEEVLRLDAPIVAMWRIVTRDTELGGVHLPAGSRLLLRFISANHDESAYECPSEVVLDRDKPRNHVTFGGGIHYCLGAALARKELTVGTTLLLERTSWIRPVDDSDPSVPPHMLLRGPKYYEVELEPR